MLSDAANHPQKLSLGQALAEIKDHINGCRTPAFPFFLMVGAGVSAPVIPTAARIIEDCKSKLGASCHPPPGFDQDYSWHVERGFQSREERWKYFFEMIHGKPLSRANRLLALALKKRALGDLLLTTNFDDQVEHALHVLEENPAVVDSPDAIDHFTGKDLASPKILYLHGKFVFQDLANIDEEIRRRSDNAIRGVGSETMYHYVVELLKSLSPIVFGYSGTVDDIFMKGLRERRQTADRPPAYWFCYDEQSRERLLRVLEDESVRVVLAESGTLPAHSAIDALLKTCAPNIELTDTPWSIPRLTEIPDENHCSDFVRAASGVRSGELETTELADLGRRLVLCSDTLKRNHSEALAAAELALKIAERLYERDRSVTEHCRLLAVCLLANGSLRVDLRQYQEGLPFLARISEEFGASEDGALVRCASAANFVQTEALDGLGRKVDSEILARKSISAYGSRKEADILGYTTLTASYIAAGLGWEGGAPDRIAEAMQWISWVESVYPGPIEPNCIVAYYRAQFILAQILQNSGEDVQALRPLCTVVAGGQYLKGTAAEGCVAFALLDRVRIWTHTGRFLKADLELRRIGRLFGREVEYMAREDFGKHELVKAMMKWGLGLRSPTLCDKLLEIARICDKDAPTVELRRQLAHLLRMRAAMKFQLQLYEECNDASDAYLDRFGAVPESVLKFSAEKIIWLKLRAVCALVGGAIKMGKTSDVARFAEKLQHDAESARRSQPQSGYFCLAYAQYLRGEIELAATSVINCARLADATRRDWLLESFLRPPETEFDQGESSRELQPLQEVFREWFCKLAGRERPTGSELRAEELPRGVYETFRGAFEGKPTLQVRWIGAELRSPFRRDLVSAGRRWSGGRRGMNATATNGL